MVRWLTRKYIYNDAGGILGHSAFSRPKWTLSLQRIVYNCSFVTVSFCNFAFFNGVTISDAAANVSTDYVDFVGTYAPVGIYTDEKINLYLGADNTVYYPVTGDFTVNAFRGYFQLKQGLTANPN